MMNSPAQIVRIDSASPRWMVEQIARLHQTEIPTGFLSSMGESFLGKLYASLAKDSSVVMLAQIEQNTVTGFICGVISARAVQKRLLRHHPWQLGPAVLRRLTSVSSIKRILETLLYPARTGATDLPEPEVLNFVVGSPWRREGRGRNLFESLRHAFQQQCVNRFRIVVSESQEAGRRFNEAIGGTLARTVEVHRGQTSLIYVHQQRNAQRAAA